MELYFPTSEYDLETVSSVLFSLVSLVLTALMIAIGCFPESKLAGLFFAAAAASKAQAGAAGRKEGGRGAGAERGTAGTVSAAAAAAGGKAHEDQVTIKPLSVFDLT